MGVFLGPPEAAQQQPNKHVFNNEMKSKTKTKTKTSRENMPTSSGQAKRTDSQVL